MWNIVIRHTTVGSPAERVERAVAVGGTIVDELAPGVAHVHRESLGKPAIRRELQRIVARIANAGLSRDGAEVRGIDAAGIRGAAWTSINCRIGVFVNEQMTASAAHISRRHDPAPE